MTIETRYSKNDHKTFKKTGLYPVAPNPTVKEIALLNQRRETYKIKQMSGFFETNAGLIIRKITKKELNASKCDFICLSSNELDLRLCSLGFDSPIADRATKLIYEGKTALVDLVLEKISIGRIVLQNDIKLTPSLSSYTRKKIGSENTQKTAFSFFSTQNPFSYKKPSWKIFKDGVLIQRKRSCK